MYSRESDAGLVVFLIAVALTVVAWVFFEWHHSQNPEEIPSEIQVHTGSTYPPTFDIETLEQLYESRNELEEKQSIN